ncbi:MAG: glycosyltransferase family 2 protein [Alteripontixanthobacter sp.]
MIDILLATYNGAAHLSELLASLTAQTHRDWRLIVRDDGSADETLSLISHWAQTARQPVLILEKDGPGQGASANFAALLARSDAPYFAFCDQDDVWLPHKLETMLAAIRGIEADQGSDHPVLAHSDLAVVDETLKPAGRTLWEMLRYDPRRPIDKRSALLENFITGCATLGNAALRERAAPVPAEAMMHDWWAALVAIWFGTLVPVEQPTILYRQHGKNVVGATDWGAAGLIHRFLRMPRHSIGRTIRGVRQSQIQAGAFAGRFRSELSDGEYRLALDYSGLPDRSFLTRKCFMIRRRFFASYPARNVFYWMVM